MTERVRVTGDQRVKGQTSKNMPGDPARLPVQTTKEWLDTNGATGLIEASAHWNRKGHGKPPRPKSKAESGVQMTIEEVLMETADDGNAQVDWAALARAGRKTDIVREDRREPVVVSNVLQFRMRGEPLIDDTPESAAKVISDCETIAQSPVATTPEED